MNINTAFSLFNLLRNDTISFLYQGSFTNVITAMVIDLIDTNLDSTSGFAKLRNKISFLMMESFQNIIRHGDAPAPPTNTKSAGIFLTRNIGNCYFITSANIIENSNIPPLKQKLQQVNTLEKDALKDLYMEVLAGGEISIKGGAGLGLIEMARKSGNKLDYDFETIDEEFSHFYLQLKLSGKNTENTNDTKLPITEARLLHDEVSKGNLFVVHKGNFSQDAIRPVLKMVESNIQSENANTQRVTFHILVEILQNISQHSFSKNGEHQGIFLMGTDKDLYSIVTGNFIENSQIEKFKKLLDKLNSIDKKKLDELYRKILINDWDDFLETSGLGMVDIGRSCCGDLIYNFHKIDEEISFFTLLVNLKSEDV